VTSEDPVNLAAVNADDTLLDAVGQGAFVEGDDELAEMLVAWRADLDEDLPVLSDVALPSLDDRRRVPRLTTFLTLVAAAVVVLAGFAVAVHRAGPDSPLWPMAQVMYPDQSDIRAAERTISLARQALTAGEFDRAGERLDEANVLVNRIDDRQTADRLRAEIADLRRQLPTPTTGPPSPSAPSSPTTAPTPTTAPQPATPAPGSTTKAPDGGGKTPGGGSTTKAPGLPAPTLPLPTIIPTPSLPGLPLPTLF
jgi:hypothetical protein